MDIRFSHMPHQDSCAKCGMDHLIWISMRAKKNFTQFEFEFVGTTEWAIDCRFSYRLASNISRTLVSNTNIDHSGVVGASPVGAAPTTSSFST